MVGRLGRQQRGVRRVLRPVQGSRVPTRSPAARQCPRSRGRDRRSLPRALAPARRRDPRWRVGPAVAPRYDVEPLAQRRPKPPPLPIATQIPPPLSALEWSRRGGRGAPGGVFSKPPSAPGAQVPIGARRCVDLHDGVRGVLAERSSRGSRDLRRRRSDPAAPGTRPRRLCSCERGERDSHRWNRRRCEMTTTDLDPVFASALRDALVAHVEGTARRRRRWRWRLGFGILAGTGVLAGGAAVAATLLSAPGATVNIPLSAPVTVTKTGTASVALGAPPKGTTGISWTLTCLSSGTFTFTGTGGASVTCSEGSHSSYVQPLHPGQPRSPSRRARQFHGSSERATSRPWRPPSASTPRARPTASQRT